MKKEGDYPHISDSSSGLGIRFKYSEHDFGDILVDSNDFVQPKSGGLSVAPEDYMFINPRFRPKRLGNGSKAGDDRFIFSIEREQLGHHLNYRDDEKNRGYHDHGFIEPAFKMNKENYKTLIVETKNLWQIEV